MKTITRNLAYKFRIYPNKEQREFIDNSIRVSNFTYNHFLREQIWLDEWIRWYGCDTPEIRKQFKKDNKLYFNYIGAGYEIVKMKKDPRFSFLKEVHSSVPESALDNLKKAFENMWKTNSGFPNFKNKHTSKSYRTRITTTAKVTINIINGHWAKFKLHTPRGVKINDWVEINLSGHTKTKEGDKNFIDKFNEGIIEIKSYTISINQYGQYFVAFLVKEQVPKVNKKKLTKNNFDVVGVDMGVVRPATVSDEESFNLEILSNRIDLLKTNQKEKKRLERALAKKRLVNSNWKESKKYHREKKKLSKLYTKITNQRKDIQNRISKLISEMDADIIALEKLNVKGMMKKSAPGKSNQKRHLTRTLSDVGIFEIQRQITYKSDWLGKRVIKVAPNYTSQECSNCGHTDKKNRPKNTRIFTCVECGHSEDSDLNAAKNIKNKAVKEILEKKMDESLFI